MHMSLCLLVGLALRSASTALAQVELPRGFEIVDVHPSENFTDAPSLNNCGQIAYGKRLGGSWSQADIHVYENGRITRITDNGDRDVFPDINDAGVIVWMRGTGSHGADQIILYDMGEEIVLDPGGRSLGGVAINNSGQVVWTNIRGSRCPLRSRVYLYHRGTIKQLAHSDFLNQSPDMNDATWVTWGHSDDCYSDPWWGTIQLYFERRIVDLPSSATQVQGPKINNMAEIVWDAQSNLELWDGQETRVILDTVDAAVPDIGNNGDVYFSRWDYSRRRGNAWLYRVEDGWPHFYRLTNDDRDVSRGSVNAWGEVAWVDYKDPVHSNWSGGIRYLRRIRTGDSEFDGDIDLVDFAVLHDRLTGPVPTTGLCEARFLDLDHDEDIDLADFARFQNAFEPR